MRLHHIAAALGVAVLAAAPAGAQEGTLKKIKETGAIALGHRDSSVPFSYLDDKQQPIGYAMDICAKIVDAVKKELKLDKLEVKLTPVTSSTRISGPICVGAVAAPVVVARRRRANASRPSRARTVSVNAPCLQ